MKRSFQDVLSRKWFSDSVLDHKYPAQRHSKNHCIFKMNKNISGKSVCPNLGFIASQVAKIPPVYLQNRSRPVPCFDGDTKIDLSNLIYVYLSHAIYLMDSIWLLLDLYQLWQLWVSYEISRFSIYDSNAFELLSWARPRGLAVAAAAAGDGYLWLGEDMTLAIQIHDGPSIHFLRPQLPNIFFLGCCGISSHQLIEDCC